MSQDDDVERVARAICIAAGNSPCDRFQDGRLVWREYEHIARAALSALPERELLAEALDALTPFAVGARSIDVDPPGDHEPSHGRGSVTAGDLRRARAAADKIRAALTQEKKP